MAAHLALLEEEYRSRGMSEEEAKIAARRRFGATEKAQDLHRDARVVMWLEHFFQDVRFSLRMLRTHKVHTTAVVLTLALAIGANTAMFSFVDGIFLSPLPYPDADRIVSVLERRPGGGRNAISTLNYLDWAEQNTVFEYLAAQASWGATMTGGDEPVQVQGQRVSPDYFRIHGTTAGHGRTFVPGEDEVGNDDVVVLSRALWENRFGGDPNIVGTEIEFDGEPHTIIGVLSSGDSFDRSGVEVWKPLAFEPSTRTRDFHWFGAFGKLKEDVTFEQAQAEFDVIGQRIAEAYPDSNKDWGIVIDPLEYLLRESFETRPIFVLFSATAFVLLIGCANLASLALTRGIAREREVAVRASLGAGRWRLARQILTENIIVALIGGLLGIVVAFATMRGILAMIPPFIIPFEFEIELDFSVMVFAMAVAIASGLLLGLAPAVQATRSNLALTMNDGGRGSTQGTPGRRLRGGLVVAEVALAFVLLVGAGLMLRSLVNIVSVDPGFDSANVLTAALPITQARYPEPAALNAYLDSIRENVEAVPGVEETAVTSALPLQGGYRMLYLIADRELVDRANLREGRFKMVSPSYFGSLRIRLVAGRFLEESDRGGTPPVMLINQTMAEREFEGEDPIGQHILVQEIVPGVQQFGDEIPWEIVGVIADEKISGIDDTSSVGMYVSNAQSPTYGVSLLVRTGLDPRNLEPAVRDAIENVNPDQAMSQVRTLEQIQSESVFLEGGILGVLLGAFAALALLLASIGIYGVIAYSVSQRTQELGVRSALGADAGNLRTQVFVGGMRLAAIGLVIGVVGALALARVMSSFVFDISVYDPLTLAAVMLVLTGVAAVACFIPARRVTRIDPMAALRCQ
jgi:putative ABC transport system permease protein